MVSSIMKDSSADEDLSSASTARIVRDELGGSTRGWNFTTAA
jgi:hypothetical protein